MQELRNRLVRMLREAADNIAAGTCEMSEAEAMDIMSVVSHQIMSKEDACDYLNINGKKFDNLVKKGKLPKGKKRKGFKELRYYKDELNSFIK